MNIGFDIDYTITNPFNYEYGLAIKYLKDNGLPTIMKYPEKFGMLEKFGISNKEANKFWDIIAVDVLKNGDLNGNIKEVIDKLKADGHKIILITARGASDLKCVNPYVLSFLWLKEKGIKFDKIICRDTDKVQNCLKYNVDIFIDDNINVIHNLSAKGIDSILISAPHNKQYKEILPSNVNFANCPNDIYEIISQKTNKTEIQLEK